MSEYAIGYVSFSPEKFIKVLSSLLTSFNTTSYFIDISLIDYVSFECEGLLFINMSAIKFFVVSISSSIKFSIYLTWNKNNYEIPDNSPSSPSFPS